MGIWEVAFVITRETDQNVVGVEWEVIDTCRGWLAGRGEVVAQSADAMTIPFRRISRDLPAIGRLNALLGSNSDGAVPPHRRFEQGCST
ncbi:hypothetical protein ABGB17_35790 [Sphaerisporangium sp. B11E5]|uniref:hypothetical protein n=1 Tax=Sphaerisporangium sp. B11E5 TaxID=3153563 RepID=UPI00325F1FD7